MFAERSRQLIQLRELCRSPDIFGTEQCAQAVELLRQLGRFTEAEAWCYAARRVNPGSASTWTADVLRQLPQASMSAELTLPGVFDTRPDSNNRMSVMTSPTDVHLEDVASDVGLDFAFYSGRRANEAGRRMYEATGGGVGVLDLDGDAWPDLMLTQGNAAPLDRSDPKEPTDQLFRNLRGQQFADVTATAGISESNFGQGLGVGDVNNDGGDNVLTHVCEHGGRPGICGPTDFPAEQDVLLYGTGEGRFQPADSDSGIVQPDGRGMGIVVGDVLHSGTSQIFVANDESANYFFEPNDSGQLVETAVVRGLAVGRNGTAQVLGRAVARLNWNRDGRVDLCVTHLDRPVALLENHTECRIRSLALGYTGTKKSRDGVGTIVRQVRQNRMFRYFPVLAGDGYACSNERLSHSVNLGSGVDLTADDHIRHFDVTEMPGPGTRFRIIEGRPDAWSISD